MRYCVFACFVLGILAPMALAQPAPAIPTPYQKGLAAHTEAGELAKAKKPLEAIAAYQQMVKDFPMHESADMALMQIWTLANGQKQHDTALAACDQLLNKYPKSARITQALVNKATSLRALGRHAETVAVHQQLAAIPGYAGAEGSLWGVIDAYVQVKDTEKALAAIDAYLAADMTEGARRPQALQQKLTLLFEKDDQAGITATLAQIAAFPGDKLALGNAYLALAQGYDRKKDPVKTAHYYKLVSDIPAFGNNQANLLLAATRLTTAKQTPEAIALYREYLTRYPRGAQAIQSLGNIATLNRDVLKDRANEAAVLEELLRAYPNTHDAATWLTRLAQAYVALKNTESALATYKKISDQFPGTRAAADALYQQGELNLNVLRNRENAKAIYQQIVANYEGTGAAQNAANRLTRL